MKYARFTIIEILVVITIIIILAGLMFPVIRKVYLTSDEARIRADITRITYILDTQREADGYLPLSVGGATNALQPPAFPNIHILSPDDTPYVYEHKEGTFQIIYRGDVGEIIETL